MPDNYLPTNTENSSSSENRPDDPNLLFYRSCLTIRNSNRNLCCSDVPLCYFMFEHRCQRIMKK